MTVPSSNDPFSRGPALVAQMLKTGKGGTVTMKGYSWSGTPGNITFTPSSVEVMTNDQMQKAIATLSSTPLTPTAKTPSAPPPPTIPITPPPPTITPLTPPVVTKTYVKNGIHITKRKQLPAVITTTDSDGKQTIRTTGEAGSYTVSPPPVSPPPVRPLLPIKSLWHRLVDLIEYIYARIIKLKMDYLNR